MKNIQYAKCIISHGDFRLNNLYEVVNITDYTIEVKVKDKQVITKKNNFEIFSCIFDSDKNENSN